MEMMMRDGLFNMSNTKNQYDYEKSDELDTISGKSNSKELSIFYKNNKLNFVLTIIAEMLNAAANILIAFVLIYIVDGLSKLDSVILYEGLILAGVFLIILVLSLLSKRIFVNRFIMTGLGNYKNSIFQRVLNKDIGEFGNTASGKFINAFTNDLVSIEQNYLMGSVRIISQILLLGASIVAMATINFLMMGVVMVALIIPLIYALFVSDKLVKKETQTSDENESFVDQVRDLLNGFTVIKSFNAEKKVLELFKIKNFVLEDTKKERRKVSDSMEIVGAMSSMIIVAVIIVFGGYLTFTGSITIGVVLGFVQLSNFLSGPILELFPLMSNRKASKALVYKVANALKGSGSVQEKQEIFDFEKEISFDKVSFSYENNDINTLTDIDAVFLKDRSYAIVGLSGGGKSTVLRLIQGYYDNYEGSLKLDEMEVSSLSPSSISKLVSVIEQNVFLFDSSIEDNITLFNKFSSGRIGGGGGGGGLTSLIKEKGYEYSCGKGGQNLSGGEKQRVSIARALLKDSKILLIDEATSALDNATSHEIMESILNLKGITRLIVTHKIEKNQLKRFDEIIVLNNGMIVEKGSFNELIANKEFFYSLYNVSYMV
jgi:ABC-type multidrug transport system fused ATPase/permease subunit